jgi:23S rRNA pseudouridine1911/1915/1917 synthase
VVWPAHDGGRLDVALAALAGLPRRRARAVIGEGRVWVNGAPVRVLSRPLHTGDVVDVIERGEPLAAPAPLPALLPLLHEDGWLIAVDKPAGLASQPRREPAAGELAACDLLALQLALREGSRQLLALFHRLDRITSGVMVFPRHHQASAALAATWRAGRAEKRYLAVVRGDPGARPVVVERAVSRDPLSPGRVRTDRRGDQATTRVARVALSGGLALVEARPLTGRTHQVRVHLADLGCPVAGDTLYGGGRDVPRPYLHAWRLALPHPRDGRRLELVAPLPADMAAFLEAHGLLATDIAAPAKVV